MAFPAIDGIDMTGACHDCCEPSCPDPLFVVPAYLTFDTPGSPCLDGQVVTLADGQSNLTGGPCSCDGPFVVIASRIPDTNPACYVATWCSGGCTPVVTYGTVISSSPLIVEFTVPDCGSFSSGGTATYSA